MQQFDSYHDKHGNFLPIRAPENSEIIYDWTFKSENKVLNYFLTKWVHLNYLSSIDNLTTNNYLQ